ncbi:unnamed protein product [Rangifer tarandus platyrhynchus]|uniref:Uncharacterized protein n=1 Tax=Rangifer tarandus platyrhynchus TaxID=3082113 RepID=A0AC59Z728_RANTA
MLSFILLWSLQTAEGFDGVGQRGRLLRPLTILRVQGRTVRTPSTPPDLSEPGFGGQLLPHESPGQILPRVEQDVPAGPQNPEQDEGAGTLTPHCENLAELAKQSPHPEPNPPHTAPDLSLAGRGGEEWTAVRVEAAFELRVLTRVLTRSRWNVWRCLTSCHVAALGGTLASSPADSGWEPAALMLVDEAAEHPSPPSSLRGDPYSDRLPET